MGEFSIDDLPDHLREAIEEIVKSLSEMSPDDILKVFEEMFGKTMIDQMEKLFATGGGFSFILDEYTMKKFEEMIDAFNFHSSEQGLYQQEVEPYYEITDPVNNFGEIIIELPGITGTHQIEWYELDDEIYLYTVNSNEAYKLVIPIHNYLEVLEDKIRFTNGLFILPYTIRN